MAKLNHQYFNTYGTSVRTRLRPAVNPNSFGIDERSLSDLMVLLMRYAENVQFINNDLKPDGNWKTFFEGNLAFLLAKVATLDTDKLDNDFQSISRKVKEENKSGEAGELFDSLLNRTKNLFELINNWYQESKSDVVHLDENKFYHHLTNLITQKLNLQIRIFKEIWEHFEKSKTDFDEIINIKSFIGAWKSLDIKDIEYELPENRNNALADLSRVHKELIGILINLKNLAPGLLKGSLEKYPYHPSHISVLVSFLKSFQHLQTDLNGITGRHLDYYYQNILKQKPKSSQPDFAHIYFEPSEHILKHQIEEGTLLMAGTDEEGLNYTYETTESIELNQAQITDLKVIHIAHNNFISQGKTFKSVSNIYSKTNNINEQGLIIDQNGNPSPFNTFGVDQVDFDYASRDMEQAKLGFAVSSPILLLKEGYRKIQFTYSLNLKSMSSLISFIEEMVNAADEEEAPKAKKPRKKGKDQPVVEEASRLSPQAALYKLLSKIFVVRATTSNGWFETDSYEILPSDNWTEGELAISLNLDISDPAISEYDEEIHQAGLSCKWPVFEFTLSSQNSMYAYTYLRDLIIEECKIEVSVEQLKALEVFNDLGKIDIHKPFYPFGSTPELGSYFLIGNEELARKRLTNIDINIHWHNLPRNEGGFEKYYSAYKNDTKNSSFEVGLRGLSEFQFHPLEADNVEKIQLFKNQRGKKVLDEYRSLNKINLKKLNLQPNYKELSLDDYSSQTRSGFLRFEITGPEMGFGFSDYPKLFSQAVVENAKTSSGLLSMKEKEKAELPNEPYAPQIRSMALNYTAETTLRFDPHKVNENDKECDDKIYHIYPFGKEVIYKNGLPAKSSLVPRFEDEGYLIIGLENIQPPTELSLYFELIDNIKNEINQVEIPNTRWHYLHGDTWVDFDENDIVSDSTNSFTTSGIIKIKLPTSIDTNHSILPPGKFWISVSCENSTQIISRTAFIQTNAVTAKWTPHKAGEQWQENIEPGTINGLLESRAEVNSVNQPFKTFGGSPLENTQEFYVRVSERLKHKNRCVTPDDYEKIILDKFPYLFQAKCINHFSHPEYIKTGSVKVIVVPKISDSSNPAQPKVDYNQLDSINKYIKKFTSPFTNVEVINPVYEEVRINCQIRLHSDLNSGSYIKKLENDLKEMIAPWVNKEQKEIEFGGTIERDDILTFLESLPYIRFITKLSVTILHNVDGKYSISDSAVDQGRENVLHSSTPWSVLVAADSHDIGLIEQSSYAIPEETRIDTMKIGTNFVITDEAEEDIEFPKFDIDKDTYYEIDISL